MGRGLIHLRRHNVDMWEILIFHMPIFFSKKIAGANIEPIYERK